jgi:hypothetical protein
MPAAAEMLALQVVGNDGRSARGPARPRRLANFRLLALWGLQVMWVPGVLGVFRLLSIRRGPGEGRLFRTAWLGGRRIGC